MKLIVFCCVVIMNMTECQRPEQHSLRSIMHVPPIQWELIQGSNKPICVFEMKMRKYALIDITSVIPDILVDLRYASENNFTGTNLYGCLKKAYAHPDLVERLVVAQQTLHNLKPGYRLIIYDAARPFEIQKILSDHISLPPQEKWKYISSPTRGSLHNYGLAIDVSIVDEQGVELDMGTPYDYFGPEAEPAREIQMLSEGKLTLEQVKNRELLRTVMRSSGLRGIPGEWWHFQLTSRNEAEKKYQIIY